MRAKKEKKRRKVFNIYNLLVLLSIVVILGAGNILLKRNGIDAIAEIKQRLPEDWFNGSEQDVAQNGENKTLRANSMQTPTPTPTQNTNIVSSGVASGDEISEDKAKDIAIAQFKTMGETSLQKSEIEIMQIQRSGELYYYISSPENTAEIKVKGGKITRLNGASVDK